MKILGVDGCDYSGKSRLADLVAKKAESEGWTVITQPFPSKEGNGAKARIALAAGESASKVAHLIEKDFRDFSKRIIDGNYDDRTLIILDRYVITTFSHQGHIVDLQFGEYIIPDVQVLLTLDYETMTDRVRERGGVDWDEVETNKYKSPLKWKELNNRYEEGMEHYSNFFGATLLHSGTDDKEDIADTIIDMILD